MYRDVVANTRECAEPYCPSLQTQNADWDQALGVNVKGYALGTKHASLAMSQQQAASVEASNSEHQVWPYSILNIASVNSFRAFKDLSPYCAAKGAVAQLTKSSAYDLAKFKIR